MKKESIDEGNSGSIDKGNSGSGSSVGPEWGTEWVLSGVQSL